MCTGKREQWSRGEVGRVVGSADIPVLGQHVIQGERTDVCLADQHKQLIPADFGLVELEFDLALDEIRMTDLEGSVRFDAVLWGFACVYVAGLRVVPPW